MSKEAKRQQGLTHFQRLMTVGKAVEAHADMLAFDANSKADLKKRHSLGIIFPVGNTEPQPLQMDVPTMRKSYKALVLPEFIAPPDPKGDFLMPRPEEYLREHKKHKNIFDGYVNSSRRLHDVRTAGDLRAVLRSRRAVALMKSVEGVYVDEHYASTIDTLIKDGVVSFGLMWNFDNGTGKTTKPAVRNAPGAEDTGLDEPLGYNVVKEIDRRGGIVDLAHASDETIWNVLTIPSEKPRIDTHAGSRSITPHNRNVSDDVAELLINGGKFVKDGDTYKLLNADAPEHDGDVYTVTGGGIIGIPFVATFAGKSKSGESTVENVVDHIEHFKDKGLLHGIVLGTDFDGMAETSVVKGVENAKVFRKNLKKAMRSRGFSRQEINQVFYENALNFWLKNLPQENNLPGPGQEATVYPTVA